VFHGPHATRPAENGSVVYLNCSGKLDAVVGRVAAAGGAVLMPPTPLDRGLGRIAVIRDSEGNRVGLHAFAG
jgi:predicted enzyme related to lactoylglutathione lyase